VGICAIVATLVHILCGAGHLAAYSPQTAKQLIEHDVLSAVVSLMKAPIQV
jgi:hypothetical protein